MSGSPMKLHRLKCWPDYFQPLSDGVKSFDLRRNDRGFAVGDVVRLQEFDDRTGTFTGRECDRRIVFMLEGAGPGAVAPLQGLLRGYAILGLERTPAPKLD